MLEKIGEKVSVITVYDRTKGLNMPVKVKWQGRVYPITKLGYHHKFKAGRTLIHVFSVCNDDLAFRLEFDTDNLQWVLQEISDGIAS
jgi:hypothetical protein